MQKEMAKLRAGGSPKPKDAMFTPPPRVAAPSPGSTPAPSHGGKKHATPQPPVERPPPATEGAKMNRLRRLCEMKPSGRCNVPMAVHERWAKSTKDEKEAMIEELEKANWSKDWSSSYILQ